VVEHGGIRQGHHLKPYYQQDGITIYHGDSRDVIPALAPVHLVLTDPPYGVNLGNHDASKEKRPQYLAKQKYASYDDTYANFLSVVVPVVDAAIKHSERAIVFCAGTMMWDFPRPTAVGGVFLPAACGRNAWGFSSLAHCMFYGSSPDLHKGSKAIAISSTDIGEKNGHPCPKPLPKATQLDEMACFVGEQTGGNRPGPIHGERHNNGGSKAPWASWYWHRDRREVLRDCRWPSLSASLLHGRIRK